MDNKNIKALELLFWQEITNIINDESVKVRRGWQTNGAPDWKITDNVVFMTIRNADGDDITQPIDDKWEEREDDFLLTQGMTRNLELRLIAYGDRAYENLLTIKHKLLQGTRSLRSNKIYIVPGADNINTIPELFQGRWWERADLRLRFNSLITFATEVNAVKEVSVTINANSSGSSEDVATEEFIIDKN